MNKPAVYNPENAEKRIRELEKNVMWLEREKRELQRQLGKKPSYWEEMDDGIACHNCTAFFFFDENLKEMEKPFAYCPECGCVMLDGEEEMKKYESEM